MKNKKVLTSEEIALEYINAIGVKPALMYYCREMNKRLTNPSTTKDELDMWAKVGLVILEQNRVDNEKNKMR